MEEADKKKKKSSRVTSQKAPGEKLKTEESSREAVRKKLRYGKKDNSLTLEEQKKIKQLQTKGRKQVIAQAAVSHRTHNQISEKNEDENAGTEALNFGMESASVGMEMIAQGRYGQKLHQKQKGQEQERKLQDAKKQEIKKQDAAKADGSNPASKAMQKKKLKREMVQSAERQRTKDSAKAAGAAGRKVANKAGDLMSKVGELLLKKIAENPVPWIVGIVIAIVLLVLVASLSSCSMMAGGVQNSTVSTTFTAEDEDILGADEDYCALEDALQEELDDIETDYPDCDEYRYSLAEIGHNPYQLAALLTVLYEDYSRSEVQGMLQTIFDAQYELTIQEVVETRTRTEERTGTRTVWDPTTGTYVEEEYTYDVEVEYDYYILKVTLTNATLDAVVRGMGLTDDQMQRYELLLETYGNKAYLFGDDIYSNSDPGEYQDYDIPPEYLTDQKFANMIRCAEQYLGYPYVWGGSSPSTSFDCSGYVSYVINNCGNGWNVGRQTANGLLGCCTEVSASEAEPGDLIFFQGTYNVRGASHVGIYVGDGMMLHCGNPIQYTSINTSYWQEHFYTYGKIR